MGVFKRYQENIISIADTYRCDAQKAFKYEYEQNSNFDSSKLIADINTELSNLHRLFYKIEMSAYTPETCKLNIRKLYEMIRYMFFRELKHKTVTAADNTAIQRIIETHNNYTANHQINLTLEKKGDKIPLPKTAGAIAAIAYYKETFPTEWPITEENIERYFQEHESNIRKIVFLYILCCDELHISATRVSDRIVVDTINLEHIQVVLLLLKAIAKIKDTYEFNPLDLILCFDSNDPDEAWNNIDNIEPTVYGTAEAHPLRLYTRKKFGHTEYAYIDIMPAISISEKQLREYKTLCELYSKNNGENGFGKPNYYINSTFAVIERSFCREPLQLRDYLANKKLNIKQKFNLIIKITEHIMHIHRSNVYHRLLTPEHILISFDNSNRLIVSILGFHGAKLTYNDEQHATVFYEVQPNFVLENKYTAPELYNTHINDTDSINWEKCDAYSLGKIAEDIIYYGQENNENFHKMLISCEHNKAKLDLLKKLTDSTNINSRPNLSTIVEKLKSN